MKFDHFSNIISRPLLRLVLLLHVVPRQLQELLGVRLMQLQLVMTTPEVKRTVARSE